MRDIADPLSLAVMEKNNREQLLVREILCEGQEVVDIRMYLRNDRGALRPTKKGLNISRKRFGEFVDTLVETREKLNGRK